MHAVTLFSMLPFCPLRPTLSQLIYVCTDFRLLCVCVPAPGHSLCWLSCHSFITRFFADAGSLKPHWVLLRR